MDKAPLSNAAQLLIFPDLLADRTNAIEADIAAAGGYQVVGHKLKLNDDPTEAGKILNNRVRMNGRHRLTEQDVWHIRQWARESATGRSQLHELENSALNFEGRWLTTEDIKARRRKRKADLLAELLKLEQEEE